VSKSGLIEVVEKVRLRDLHLFAVFVFTWGVHLFVLLRVCVLCLYSARACGPLSHSVTVDSSCHVGC